MLKIGDRADMYHAGTKNWYTAVVESGPLTYEQVVGPEFLMDEPELVEGLNGRGPTWL